jgi:hypothetical protein
MPRPVMTSPHRKRVTSRSSPAFILGCRCFALLPQDMRDVVDLARWLDAAGRPRTPPGPGPRSRQLDVDKRCVAPQSTGIGLSRHGHRDWRARRAPATARSGRSGPPASRKGSGTGARWPGAGTRDHEHEGFRGSADGEHGEISPRGLFVLRMTPEDPGRPLSRYLPFNKWMSSLRWTVMNSLPPGRRIRLSSAIHASARSSIRCRPDRGHERMPAR